MRSMLVIGAGRFGENLAKKLTSIGCEVLLVDKDENQVNRFAPFVTGAQIGDCMDRDVLHSLGVRNFDICFVCISQNFQSSMEITSLLKEEGAAYVVSKSDSSLHAELLMKIGADEVVYPERDMAWRTAIKFSTHGAFDYIELSPEYAIFEIAVPDGWVGHSIGELDVRSKHNINVIGVRNNDKKVTALTSADYIFAAEDHVIVACSQKDIMKMIGK
jgi:trk system potassium uptake protein TrkA